MLFHLALATLTMAFGLAAYLWAARLVAGVVRDVGNPSASLRPEVFATQAARYLEETIADTVPSDDELRSRPGMRRLTTQVLFADLDVDEIVLDLIVLDGGDTAHPGAPLTLHLQPPDHHFLDLSVAILLSRWSDDGEIVDLWLTDRAGEPRVELVGPSSRVRLDVLQAAGLG